MDAEDINYDGMSSRMRKGQLDVDLQRAGYRNKGGLLVERMLGKVDFGSFCKG